MRDVPDFRRCPLCWGGRRGVGNVYSTHGRTRYYKCNCCGHTWTAIVKMEAVRIEHRIVTINTRA